MINPCKGCRKRHAGCHARCREYGDWKLKHDDAEAARKAEKESWPHTQKKRQY